MKIYCKTIPTIICCLFLVLTVEAQNSKIKCYFNKPVNNALSSGTNAVYLNGTFPDTIAAYINRAKYTLDIAVYNFTSNGTDIAAKIATAVNNAYARGVIVRWVYDSSSTNSGLTLLNAAIPTIGSPTSSSYGIMHNKFVVIDVNSANTSDQYVITGSYNFSVQQTNTDYNNIVIIQDKNVALAYYNEFNKMWGGTGNTPNLATSTFGTRKTTSSAHYFNVNGSVVQVHFSPKDTCAKYIKNVVSSADNDLFFGIYAFTDNSIANPILAKFNAGVNVRGIMDNFSNSYTPYTTLSTPLGSNMISYSGTGIYHNKVMLADALLTTSDPQVGTGSFNWSTSAEISNDENFIVIHDASIANQYYQSLCKNLSDMGGTACISPVPVTWISVDAKPGLNNNAFINWVTANEYNNDHYEIESSADGVRFERIGLVRAGKNTTVNQYEFINENIHEGLNFYRIKQVDVDGNFTYSKVVMVYNRTETAVTVYPDPVVREMTIRLPLHCEQLYIYNNVGAMVRSVNTAGTVTAKVNVEDLSSGIYYIRLITKSGMIEKTFLKR